MIEPIAAAYVPASRGGADQGIESCCVNAASKLVVDTSSRSDVSVVTNEGDIVTLFSQQDITASYAVSTVTSASEEGFSTVNTRSLAYSQEQSVGFTVQGDLNEQEMRDIQKAVRLINRIFSSFLSGDLERVSKKMDKLSNLESLASVNADLHLEQSVYREEATMTKVTYASALDEEVPPVAAETAVEPAAVSEQAPAPMAGSAEDQNIAEAAGTMVEVVRNTGVDPVKVARPVDNLFAKYIEELSTIRHRSQEALRSARKLRNEFFKRLQQLMTEKPSSFRHRLGRSGERPGGALFRRAA